MLKNLKRKERLEMGLLKLGEIAQKAGVLPSAIRYYSNLGLLKVTDYTQGKYRLFDEAHTLAKMAKIKELKGKGVILCDIIKTLGSYDNNNGDK